MKLRTLVFATIAFAAATGVDAAQLSRAEISRMLGTPVGGIVEIADLPIDLQTRRSVRMKRIDVYAADAKIRLLDFGKNSELPRSNWLSFIADKSVSDAPYVGFVIAPDGSRLDGGIFGDDGRLFALEGVAGSSGIALDVWDATDKNRDGSPFSGTCANDLAPETRLPTRAEVDAAFDSFPKGAKSISAASRSARLAVDSDTQFLSERFADNTTDATTWLTSLFTQLNVIYERDLDVTLLIGDVFWRVGTDPYPSLNGGDPLEQLDEFGEEWSANNAAINRAFALQVSGKLASTGGFSGIAWLLTNRNYCTAKGQTFGGCPDGTCTFGHYSVNQTQTNTTAATAQDAKFIGHEIGHNFGANHTHCSDALTGSGSPAVSTNTIDACFNGEAGGNGGCYGGATSCPASSTINGVAGVRGTIMSYCHLLGGCGNSAVFATAHVTYLTPFIALNVAQSCFTTGAGGTIAIADRTLGEATTPMNFTLTRSNSTGTASVVATTAVGTATGGGTDYSNVSSQTVNFADGSATATLNVTINNDNIDEVDETFVVNLTTPSAGYTISDTQATGTITDDDTSSITINDPAAVTEGTSVGFTVALSNPNSRTVTVRADTTNGTAAASGDFTARSNQTLTFVAGDISEAFTVTTNNDNLNEADSEQFTVDLSNANTGDSGAVIGDAAGTGTINDNEPTPTISIADAPPQAENNVNPLRFVVTLSGPNQAAVSVTASTADGTATLANSDYQSRAISVNFASGVTSQDFDVTKFGDATFEGDETLAVNLTNPTSSTPGINILDGNATGTITNDDAGPAVSIADAARAEGDAGSANLGFNVSITNAVGADVVVGFSTTPLDATANVDYTTTSSTATIIAGNTTVTANVPVLGDNIDEFDERFLITLSPTSTSTIAVGAAIGTITDDDLGGDPIYRDGFE